jgi:lipopolysaccharide/colanic/teichoic acid biosynthesis glycosyltransferase
MHWVKRLMDVVGALLLLGPAIPVMGVLAVLSKLVQGTPITHRQTRTGLRAQPFELTKFRTMRLAPAGVDAGTTDDARVTRLGILLRRTHLDELPQLWLVLAGTMSLVGPRPLPIRYLERFSHEQQRRHDMRPGLTGLAQTSGGNALAWDQRLELDIRYVDHWSLGLDARILVRTALQLLRPWRQRSEPGVSTEFAPVDRPEHGGGVS